MEKLKQSTSITWPFFAHDVNGDGVTGMTDGGFTKRISKGGGAFGAMTVTITEMENGWYSMTLSTSHTDTLGVLTISFSNASCKRVNLQWRVSERIADDLAYPATSGRSIQVETDGMVHSDLKEWKGAVPNDLSSSNVQTSVAAMQANVLTAAAIAASALNGKGDWNIGKTGYTLIQSFPANFADLAITAGTGRVTAGTVIDKSGYTLTQAFPANFADLAITVTTGQVTVGTNNDKSGYSLANGSIVAATIAASALNGKGDWNIGKTGYSLTPGTGLGNQTADITGNLSGTIGGFSVSALADLFDTDSGTTYSAAVAGSVVKEIADNSGGGTPPSAADIADAVWDEAKAGHVVAGSFGEEVQNHALSSEISALNDLDAAGVRASVGLAAANLDDQLAALPTATENADELLKRDWTSVTGEAARSVINALRKLMNKWSISGSTLTVTKEDDTTTAYTQTITTDAGANPITGLDTD